jgi:purine-nucleoside phosphorylase
VVVLGSGLAELVELLEDRRSASYREIPGFLPAGMGSHGGEMHAGMLHGRMLLLLTARVHFYEIADDRAAAQPEGVSITGKRGGLAAANIGHVYGTLRELGASRVLLTNAAGGIRYGLTPGSLLLLRDQVDLTFRDPLVGALIGSERPLLDMCEPFDAELGSVLRLCARERGIELQEGVYAGVAGPSYETAAEIRMLSRLGADVVGMSTVHEVKAARANGMRCAALSVVTNRATGLQNGKLTHEDVLRISREAVKRIGILVGELVRR